MDEYRNRRDKNNESSAKSRKKRADKMAALKEEMTTLQERNIALKVRYLEDHTVS